MHIRLDQPATYHIQVQGRLHESWADQFGDMVLASESAQDGLAITTLCGLVTDQAALHGILSRIRDLGLILLFVQRIEKADG